MLSFRISDISNDPPEDAPVKPFSFITKPVDFETYRRAFEKVSWHLKRGDTYLINLTFADRLNNRSEPA